MAKIGRDETKPEGGEGLSPAFDGAAAPKGRTAGAVSPPLAARRARGIDRAFHILDYLQEQKRPMRPNEIAEGIGAPKSTVYDVINLLLDHNIVQYFDAEGRVFLGRKLYFFGRSYLREFDLAREAEAHLSHLAQSTRETSQLCMVEGDKYTVVMMKEGERPFRISSDVGEPVPLPWTASGRLLLSHMSDDEILDFIPPEDFVLPNGKTMSGKTFLAQVRKAREDDFFSFDSVADNFTHCFAAPVYNEEKKCVAALCLIAPREDAAKNYHRYKRVLSESATQLTRRLAGDHWAVAKAAGSA